MGDRAVANVTSVQMVLVRCGVVWAVGRGHDSLCVRARTQDGTTVGGQEAHPAVAVTQAVGVYTLAA